MTRFSFLLSEQKGQTLLESLVALGIAVTILTAIAIIVITSLNSASFSRNQNLATSYGQQTLEAVRGMVNSNYNSFRNTYTSQTYCIDGSNKFDCTVGSSGACTSNYSGSCNNIKTGIFVRQIDLDSASPECQGNLKVTVKVSWSDSKCTDRQNLYCHSVLSSSCFVDINTVPSPI